MKEELLNKRYKKIEPKHTRAAVVPLSVRFVALERS
jgi:hypothetical protein